MLRPERVGTRLGRAVRAPTDTPEFNVVAFALLLNFAWEILQAPLFVGMAERLTPEVTKACLQATVGDALIMLLAYGVVAVVGTAAAGSWRRRAGSCPCSLRSAFRSPLSSSGLRRAGTGRPAGTTCRRCPWCQAPTSAWCRCCSGSCCRCSTCVVRETGSLLTARKLRTRPSMRRDRRLSAPRQRRLTRSVRCRTASAVATSHAAAFAEARGGSHARGPEMKPPGL